MTIFLTVVHVLVCLLLIGVVLLQRGKGAEIGAVFGGGASSTVFGSRGAGNFLTRLTTGAAVVFMLTSLSLAYFAEEGTRGTLFDEEEAAQEKPAESPFAEPGAAEPAAGEQASPFQEVPAPAQQPAAGAGASEGGVEAAAPPATKPAPAAPAGEAPAKP